jgi:transcriptional regulator with XRE-family HTH domain
MWKSLDEILKREKLSYYWLSQKTGISESTLNHYCHGTMPRFDKVCKIASALGVSIDDLRDIN